ncbi:hypothetical protein B0H14DRAFT_1100133 [Mycena olivaceomarginata]|nr:hypothetical protein B0H14DRAFT_1100133 [Mycena olivaceomarginata]
MTRAISSFIPEVLDETRLSMSEAFAPKAGEKSATIPLFHTMTHLIARISNRAMLGTSLCRNETFLHDIVRFAETLVLYAQVLRWLPRILRRPAYLLASSAFGGPKNRARRSFHTWRYSLPREHRDWKVRKLSRCVLRMLTSGPYTHRRFFASHAIFHLAALSEAEQDDIRRRNRRSSEIPRWLYQDIPCQDAETRLHAARSRAFLRP